MYLTDSQWLLLQPLFTPSTSHGRPALDNRLILESIFWKLTTHQPWYDIPSNSPSWQTCYQHYHRWQHTGTWISILHTLTIDLQTRGGFNLQRALENHEIFIIKRDSSGQRIFDYPPHLKDTWQLSTAILLILLYSAL